MPIPPIAMTITSLTQRLSRQDWPRLHADLDRQGWARIGGLLDGTECVTLVAGYADTASFRSTVHMQRHGYGRGEYRYYAYPLPDPIAELRSAAYAELAPLANRWHERMGLATRFAARHADFIADCARCGQLRPTPLLLRYAPGDYNCLHRDLYGEQVFPIQLAILLDEPGRDFEGGEFVLTEQRPRMQSRVEVLPFQAGDALLFAVNQRPVRGSRSDYRVQLRHGVSPLRRGRRHTLGVIFHDAL